MPTVLLSVMPKYMVICRDVYEKTIVIACTLTGSLDGVPAMSAIPWNE